MATYELAEGLRVMARHGGDVVEFPGVLSKCKRGRWDISYDDGDKETGVLPEFIRSMDALEAGMPVMVSNRFELAVMQPPLPPHSISSSERPALCWLLNAPTFPLAGSLPWEAIRVFR